MIKLNRYTNTRKQGKDELRQSKATVRALLNIHNAAVMFLDTRANVIEVNDTMAKRFCRTSRQMKGLCLWDILPPQVTELRKKHFARVLSAAAMVRWEDERQGIWNDNAFIPIANERGKIEQVMVFAIDITARKQAEGLLRESEDRYRTIFEGSSAGILVADVESLRFIYANPAICSLLGYTLKELQRKGVPDIHPKESLAEVTGYFKEISQGLTSAAHGVPCQRKDGSVIYADISGRSMVIDGRQYNVGFFIDRTKLRLIERQLQESEALFRQIFDHAPIGVAVLNKRGALMNANPFLADMLGYSGAALKAQGIDAHLHAEDSQRSIKALLSSPEKLRKHAVHEKRYVARDGHTVYVKEYVQGVFSPTDVLVFLVVLIEDISDRIQAEALNVNIIAKLKDIYTDLHDFSAMLPADHDFSRRASIHDYKLSPIENRVASMVYYSYTNKQIASALKISENTVKHHITNIFNKFNVRSRLEFIKTIREKRVAI